MENFSFVQPEKPAVFWTKPPATVPATQSVVQLGLTVLIENLPPVIVLKPEAKGVRVMLTVHAARSPALPEPVPEKVAEVEVNAVSTPLTAKLVDAGAATAAAGNATAAAVASIAAAPANEILMAIPPFCPVISCRLLTP